MKKIIITILLPLLLIAGGVWLFGQADIRPLEQNKKLKVVTTIFPMYDFTRTVAGDKIELTNLLPPNAGPHEFSITPEEAKKIATADVLITNGVGDLEHWLPDLLGHNAKSDLVIVNTGEGAHFVETGKILVGSMELAETDPHIWLDPKNAIIQIENIALSLGRLDPDNRDFYAANARDLTAQISSLNNEYMEKLNRAPHKNFIAFHNAFNHLAYRFNLNQIGVFEEFPGKEPTPKELIEIIRVIKNKKIRALFSEPQFSPKVVQTVARDLGLKIFTLDPLDTNDFTTDSYLKIMRQNLDNLIAAFGL